MMTSNSDSTMDVSGGTKSASDTVAHPAGSRRDRDGTDADSMDSTVPQQCFIVGCPSNSPALCGKVRFFRLPPEKDRCQQWLKICRRDDLVGKPTSALNGYVICSNHFVKDHFKDASKTVLKDLAVPTIFDMVYFSDCEEDGNEEGMEFEVADVDEECEDADSDFSCQQLCRLCGSHCRDVIYIFSSTGCSLKIASKINSLLPITVASSDRLPKQVCLSCLAKLDTSKDLFETCLKTDERLRYLARKKLFRSSPCKNIQTCLYCRQQSTGEQNIDSLNRCRVPLHSSNDPGNDTSGSCNSDSKGICVDDGDPCLCPFNCGGAMVMKGVKFKCHSNENNDFAKDVDAVCENKATDAKEEKTDFVTKTNIALAGISENVVYELRDDDGRKYMLSEPLPEWLHGGAAIDNLEIIIHALDPNFKLEDDGVPAEVTELKDDAEADESQTIHESGSNLELKAELSKGHADNTCLCTLCMIRFRSPAELASHKAGHRGSNKRMMKIPGSRRFGCSICLRKFNNEKTWRLHSCKSRECTPIHCPICAKAFQTEERLAFHQKFHNGAKRNYCEKCSKQFDNESLLYYHCSLVHEGDRPYACNLCKKRFFSNARLVAHKRVHSGERPYECKECESRFYDQETLKRHQVTHMSVKPFQCELCGILCGRKSLLRQHIQVHHLTPDHLKRGHSLIHYFCKLCNKTFTGSRDVLTHKDTHWLVDKQTTGEIGSICEFCAQWFSDLSLLAKHRKESHGDEKPYICSVCKFSSHTLHEARTHRRTHTTVSGDSKPTSKDMPTKDSTLVCEECGVQFPGRWSLHAHMKFHKQESLHRCDKCTRTFCSMRKLTQHYKLHTGVKPFVCQQCGKRFSQSSALHIHILLHTGEKPHRCDLCGATFRIKADRDNHRRTHTGEKPYRCEYCSKEFRTGQVYYQHRMIHTGERRFQCDMCDKAFKRSHTLVVHKRIHTGEKPNICDICGKGFRQRTDMRKHRALHALR